MVFRRYRGGSGRPEVVSFWHFAVPGGVAGDLGAAALDVVEFGAGGGGLVLELLDGGGAVLRRVANGAGRPSGGDPDPREGDPPEDLSPWFDGWDEQRFAALVADAPHYGGYRIVEGSEVLLEVRRSVSAPVLDPAVSVRGDGAVELSLGLSDPDGDDLSYVLLHSGDGWAGWRLEGFRLGGLGQARNQMRDPRQRFGGAAAYRRPGAPAAAGAHVIEAAALGYGGVSVEEMFPDGAKAARWLVVASDGANWTAAATAPLAVPEPPPRRRESWGELEVWVGGDPWITGGCDDPQGAVEGYGTWWACNPNEPAWGCIDKHDVRSRYDHARFELLNNDDHRRTLFNTGETIELTATAWSRNTTGHHGGEGHRGEECDTRTGTKAVNVVDGEAAVWTSDIDGDLSELIRMPDGPGGRWLLDTADLTPGDHRLSAEIDPDSGVTHGIDSVYIRVRPPRGGAGVLRARDDAAEAYYSLLWARQRPGAGAVPEVVEVTANDTALGAGIAYRLTEIVHPPRWGTARIANNGRSVTYSADNFEPDPAGEFYADGGEVGSDIFAYRICNTDPEPLCDTATVTVYIHVTHREPAAGPLPEPGPRPAPERSPGPAEFDTIEDLPGAWIQQIDFDLGSYPNLPSRLWHTLIPVKRHPGPQALAPAGHGDRRWALELLDDNGEVILAVPDRFGPFDPAIADPPPYSAYRVTDNGQTLLEHTRSPTRPHITLTAPEPGAVIEGDIELQWTANDPDGDLLSYMVFHSIDGGATYHRGPRYPWGGHHNRHPGLPQHRNSHTYRRTNPHDPATILPHGAQQARFLVIATDGANWAAAESPTVTVTPMPPP